MLFPKPFRRLSARAAALVRDRRGATAIWFGLAALAITVLVFGGIDVARASAEKSRIQNALDAAVLLAARAGTQTDAQLEVIGDNAFAAQLQGSKGFARTTSSTFRNGPNDSVVGEATGKLDAVILNRDQVLQDLYSQAPVFTGNGQEARNRQNVFTERIQSQASFGQGLGKVRLVLSDEPLNAQAEVDGRKAGDLFEVQRLLGDQVLHGLL